MVGEASLTTGEPAGTRKPALHASNSCKAADSTTHTPAWACVTPRSEACATVAAAVGCQALDPGLPDHPQHAQFMSHLVNIGDTRTLISHPASTTHRQLDAAQQLAA